MDDVRVGEVLFGRYRVERVVGRGGMGLVLAATHLDLHAPVALKLLHRELMDDRGRERMLREARTIAALRGEHVARVFDVGQQEGRTYLVMELLEGRTLKGVLGEGPVSEDVAARWVLEACLALAEAHARGIVHRDLKPSNLFLALRPDGTECLKLVDFGIAKMGVDASTLTATAGALGTPQYMAPEQVRDARSADARSDLWSLGVVLYELTSGRLPYEAATAGSYLMRLGADDPVPLATRAPHLDGALVRVVDRCLQRDPSKRYENVVAFAEDLSRVLGDEGRGYAARVASTFTNGVRERGTGLEPEGGVPVTSPTAATRVGWMSAAGPRAAKRRRLLLPGVLALATALGLGAWRHRASRGATAERPAVAGPAQGDEGASPPVAPGPIPSGTTASAPEVRVPSAFEGRAAEPRATAHPSSPAPTTPARPQAALPRRDLAARTMPAAPNPGPTTAASARVVPARATPEPPFDVTDWGGRK